MQLRGPRAARFATLAGLVVLCTAAPAAAASDSAPLAGGGIALAALLFPPVAGVLARAGRGWGRWRAEPRQDDPLDLFRTLIAGSDDGIVATGPGGTIRHANAAAEKICGRSLRGANLIAVTRGIDILCPSTGAHVPLDELLQFRALNGATPEEPQQQLWRRDGGEVLVRVTARTVRDGADRPDGALFTLRDMTVERRRASALSRSAELTEALLDAVPAAIVAIDADCRIRMANRTARDWFGLARTDRPTPWPRNCRFLERDAARAAPRAEHPVVRALAGLDLRGEVWQIDCPGGARHASIDSVRIAARAEAPDGDLRTVLVMLDVSADEQRRREDERSGRLDALGQLAAGITHDFNNVLSTALGAVQLALSEPDPEARAEQGEIAIRALRRGSDLTRRLMSFAHSAPGQSGSVAVKPLLEELVDLASRTIASEIDIGLEVEDPGLHIHCDRSQFESALLNLILNAREAIRRSGTGGRVVVRARSQAGADQGEITVTDDGPGMTDEVRSRALDPFFTSRADGEGGRGLGLSIAASVARRAGGSLQIASVPGEGISVTLSLPGGMPWLAAEDDALAPDPMDGTGRSLLLVEDEDDLRRVTTDLCSRMGFAVRAVGTGAGAVAAVEGGFLPDAVLTDIVMPGGLDGFELAERLRDLVPDLPLIYMSGQSGLASGRNGLVGAPLIRKPCTTEDLSTALAIVLAPGSIRNRKGSQS